MRSRTFTCLLLLTTILVFVCEHYLWLPAAASADELWKAHDFTQNALHSRSQSLTKNRPLRDTQTAVRQADRAQSESLKFQDVTERSGIGSSMDDGGESSALVHAWGDFNNDGWVDIFTVDKTGVGTLYVNRADESFQPSEMLPDPLLPDVEILGATWIDFDNDGWQDLYLLSAGTNLLLHNENGNGFEAVNESGGEAPGQSVAASWGDVNQDGWLDLAVLNHTCGQACESDQDPGSDLLLYLNENGTTFHDISYRLRVDELAMTFNSVYLADIEADGDLDLVLLDGQTNDSVRSWTNRGSSCQRWCWTEIDPPLDFDRLDMTDRSTAVFDFDNDGWINQLDANLLLESKVESDTITEVPSLAIHDATAHDQVGPVTTELLKHRGIGLADYNRDGRIDLLLNNQNIGFQLFRNEGLAGADNRNLRFHLLGDGFRVNRDAIGSRVTVNTVAGMTHTQFVYSSTGHGSSSERMLHFGLAEDSIESVEITWPDGKVMFLDEAVVAHQNASVPWKITYPVNIMEQLGGDVVEKSTADSIIEDAPPISSSATNRRLTINFEAFEAAEDGAQASGDHQSSAGGIARDDSQTGMNRSALPRANRSQFWRNVHHFYTDWTQSAAVE